MNPGPALSFVTIPDTATDNALTEAVQKDVQYIIHIGSPNVNQTTPASQFESQIIHPIVKSTQNVLSAALNSPHAQRVVMTFSESALISYLELFQAESFTTFTDASPIPNAVPPYSTALEALSAAESQALSATHAFVAKQKPHFSVVNLLPSMALGRNELAKTSKELLEGSNSQALQHLQGEKVASRLPSTTVHVNDIALISVLSLDTQKDEKTQKFFLSSGGIQGSPWYEAKEIVKKYYADAVKKGWLSLNGEQPVNRVKIDSTRTEKVFGMKFADFEKQMRDLLDQWVELKAKEEKR